MSKETGFLAWIDSRMPTLKREWNRHMAQYYAPKNFQLLVSLWYFFTGGSGYSVGDGYLVADELSRLCRTGFCLC